MRHVIKYGTLDMSTLIISAGLDIIYLVGAVLFFRWCFHRLLKTGLVNVY